MNYVNKLLIYLRQKNGKNVIQSLEGSKVDLVEILKKTIRCNLLTKKFNSSYYGGPYPYDWYSPEFAALKVRKFGF